jgi:BirA family biotin operon repressor/biotin-[acetyl-CoA-carboxylase] ligase
MRLIHLAETDSTNRYGRDLAVGSAQEPVVIWTDYQTAGRGCGANTWESERGKNLLFSVVLSPAGITASRQFLISMAMSVAICSVVADVVGKGVSIKWPNDIYVGDCKLCGILIEHQLSGSLIRRSIVGVGLNVNQQRFLSNAPNPVSLSQLTGQTYDREPLIVAIVRRFLSCLTDAQTPARYREHLYRKGLTASYRDGQGEFQARLVDVADDGHLWLVDTAGRQRTYAFKEVQFVV